jgi:hypothetical protein
MDTAADKIREKLSEGLLPGKTPAHAWCGYGTGKPCNGCNEPILSTEVEHELDFNGAWTVRFHAACEAIWRSLIAQGAKKAVDSPIRA